MSRLLALSLAVLLAACGGGGSDGGDSATPAGNPPDANNPGNNPGGNNPGDSNPGTSNPGTSNPDPNAPLAVTGSLAFTPVGQVGVASTTATRCTLNSVISSTSVVAVVVTSDALVCGNSTVSAANRTQLLVRVTRHRSDNQPASPVEVGTYTIASTDVPADEPRAHVGVRRWNESNVDDIPAGFSGIVRSGTVTLTSVGPTIAGTVDAILQGDNRVTGSFSVPACATPSQDEICAVAGGTKSPSNDIPPGSIP
jgi:hypothetical protein